MLGFIYYLQNPITLEIFYVGCTETSLKERLRTHYRHLSESERGLRKTNKRFEYLKKIHPYKPTIVLLEIVTSGSLDEREMHYIKEFRKINPELVNMTDGGRGNNTFKYQNDFQKLVISGKISHAGKGKSKPVGFAENLSKSRTGIGNTRAGISKYGWLACYNHDIPIRMFKYGFEVNHFISSRSAFGNVCRLFRTGSIDTPYGYKWVKFSDCSKEDQLFLETKYNN